MTKPLDKEPSSASDTIHEDMVKEKLTTEDIIEEGAIKQDADKEATVEKATIEEYTTEEDEDIKSFADVLSALDKEQLPLLGWNVFQRVRPQSATEDNRKPEVGEPMYGSYHVLFPLTFHTGLRWLVKIPVTGTAKKWDEVCASSLTAEAKTMQLLKRETTIPIPEVLGFSSTTQNALRCPYILLSYIAGVPLYHVWFGHHLQGDDPEVNHTRRTRMLEGIASAMTQLGRFTSKTSGILIFADDGSPSRTGQSGRVDHKAMLDRWLVHHIAATDPIYTFQPVFSDPKSYYTFMLDLHPDENPYQEGIAALLLQLISWIPEPARKDQFVLTHPDFDMQNIIVSEDGELQGIIDWDGVAAVPHTIGNMKYPGWLTRDWDPIAYGYHESMDQGVEPEGLWEDSLSCLASYRQVYRDAIAKCQNDNDNSNGSAELCRMSLITDNLATAADDPQYRTDIVLKVAEEAWDRARHDREWDSAEFVAMFAEDRVDASVMDALHEGFDALLMEEGL